VMLPPSAMLGLAVRLTVVASVVSLMLVVAATVEAARLSKLPPVAPVMLRLTVLLSRYTSSPGAATLTVPLLAPLAMVMMLPPVMVTSTWPCAAAPRLAV
jgi:uncharacterized ion transporter superfamily protein YfcC